MNLYQQFKLLSRKQLASHKRGRDSLYEVTSLRIARGQDCAVRGESTVAGL